MVASLRGYLSESASKNKPSSPFDGPEAAKPAGCRTDDIGPLLSRAYSESQVLERRWRERELRHSVHASVYDLHPAQAKTSQLIGASSAADLNFFFAAARSDLAPPAEGMHSSTSEVLPRASSLKGSPSRTLREGEAVERRLLAIREERPSALKRQEIPTSLQPAERNNGNVSPLGGRRRGDCQQRHPSPADFKQALAGAHAPAGKHSSWRRPHNTPLSHLLLALPLLSFFICSILGFILAAGSQAPV